MSFLPSTLYGFTRKFHVSGAASFANCAMGTDFPMKHRTLENPKDAAPVYRFEGSCLRGSNSAAFAVSYTNEATITAICFRSAC